MADAAIGFATLTRPGLALRECLLAEARGLLGSGGGAAAARRREQIEGLLAKSGRGEVA